MRVLSPISPAGFAPRPVWGPAAGGWAPSWHHPAEADAPQACERRSISKLGGTEIIQYVLAGMS
jgi:hypothetical protein